MAADQQDRRSRPRAFRARINQEQLDGAAVPGGGIQGRNLAGLTLHEADLHGADFRGCDFSRADLRGANLEGTDLTDCDFTRADLHGARLRGALLHGADLAGAHGLVQDQLRGTRLPGAKLGAAIFAFDGLDRVRDLVNRAERTLYVLLLACASVAIICYASSDEMLFQSGTALTLPGLNLPVPLTAFYQLAPLVLLALYLSLSFTLRKLWVELCNLPAQFPNDRWLDQQAAPSTPSFVSALGGYLYTKERPHQSRGEFALMVLLTWWVTPAALYLVFDSYLARHDPAVTLWHLGLLGAAVLAGLAFQMNMHHLLGSRFRGIRGSAKSGWKQAFRAGKLRLFPGAPAAAATGARGGVVAHAAPRPVPGRMARALHRVLPRNVALAASALLVTGLVVGLLWREADAAMRGAGCTDLLARAAEDPGRCSRRAANLAHSSLTALHLPHGNLRRAFAYAADLQRADLEKADLSYATLVDANLHAANLKDAVLDSAVLWEAHLDSARMKEAELPGADVRGAHFAHARLQGADFSGADLRGADFTEALLCGAVLDSATRLGTATTLHRARGTEFVTFPGQVPDSVNLIQAPRGTPPAYLRPDEQREYRAWLRADDALAGLLAYRPEKGGADRRVNRDTLLARVEAIDVSMGAGTQRNQEELLRAIRAAPAVSRASADIVYTEELAKRLDKWVGKVRDKVTRHCVPTRNPA